MFRQQSSKRRKMKEWQACKGKGNFSGPEGNFFTRGMLWALFLPLMAEQFLKYSLGIADSMMVSGIGEAAISGVSLIDFVISLFNSLFSALAIGGSIVASQYLGKGMKMQAGNASVQLIWLSGSLSVLATGGIYLLRPFILGRLFGDLAPEVELNAGIYLDITALSLPFLAVYSAGAAIFRCAGNTVLPMKIMIGANLLNVGGNALLIYALDMEVAGAAWATLISRILSAVLVIVSLIKARIPFMQDARLHSPASAFAAGYGCSVGKILKVGMPYSFENGIFYLGRVLVLVMVAAAGTSALAANSVAGTIILFQVLPGMAIVTGMPVVIAHCVGAGDYVQARFYNKKILGYTYLCLMASCVLVVSALPLMLRIYGLPEQTSEWIREIVWLHALFTVLLWPLCYVLPTTFRAAGDVRFPMWTSILSMIFCRLLFSCLFGIVLEGGVVGIWLGMFVDWAAKAVVFVFRYLSGKWTRFRLIRAEETVPFNPNQPLDFGYDSNR